MIRVLIVDDSAFMRKALSILLEGAPGIQVAGTARDGAEAIELARALQPDLITMDVEMPRLNGIEAVREIMRERPVPIIMVSSVTQEGADATVEALHAGAVDFIPKQSPHVSLEINQIRDELVSKILSLTRRKLPHNAVSPPHRSETVERDPEREIFCPDARAVVIGVSTGGPFALQQLIPALPATFPVPVLVVQHMPPLFTRSLAERLNSLSPLTVREAEEGMAVRSGTVILAAGGRHLALKKSGASFTVTTPLDPPGSTHCPSVDVLFWSACNVLGGGVLGVVMTGMGKDGLAGAQEIKRRGGTVIVQDEESSVVYGMPKAVAEAGLADAAVPLSQLAGLLTKAVTPPSQSANYQLAYL